MSNPLAAVIYAVACVLVIRVVGYSISRKRFSIRDLLYVCTVVAVAVATLIAARIE